MVTLRGLGAVRLSKETDQSTSPARQQEKIEWWAEGHDCQLVHVTHDLGVSGGVSPFDRAELGEWLTDAKASGWDVLVAWKLDRISRSAEDTLKLLNWCVKRGKRIVCVDDGIDTDTEMGKVWIQLAAIFAQVERTSIRERTLGSREKLRKEGRWAGGAPVYGLRAVSNTAGTGYVIERDPDAYPHLRTIVERVLSGDSLNSVAKMLNDREVPTPQALRRQQKGEAPKETRPRWRTNTLTNILTSETLLGNMSHKNQAIRGEDGMPVKAGEAAVSLAEWKQLQSRLVENATPRSRTAGASLLLGVGKCGICGSNLHRQSSVKRGVTYLYYLCSSENGERFSPCGAKRIRADKLDGVIEETLMIQIGDLERTEKKLIPGEDHTAELEEATHAMKELSQLAGQARTETTKQLYRNQMDSLDRRIAELETLPQKQDRWVEKGTGSTYRESWESGTTEQRRQLLLNSGITIEAQEHPLQFHLNVPPDIADRMS